MLECYVTNVIDMVLDLILLTGMVTTPPLGRPEPTLQVQIEASAILLEIKSKSGKIFGIHYVTAITSNAQINIDFYTKNLGLRFVNLTVNQDLGL